MQYSFYAPTFIDESMSLPNRKGESYPTGKLSGIVMGRKFFTTKKGKVRAERLVLFFSWREDTQEAKAAALAKVIEGMEELPELDKNPPLQWIPDFIKEKGKQECQNSM